MSRAATAAVAADPAAPVAVVRHAARLRGEPRLPGDKSISHRALLLGLLAEGTSDVLGAGDGGDVRSTAAVVARLGARVERTAERDGRVDYRIVSSGRESIEEPDGILDCGNSGTTLRLVSGILAARPLFAVLDGDASLRSRPVARVIGPLSAMGATLAARRGGTLPPLAISGASPLRAIDHTTAVPSAQVKSSVLLAGLGAEGTTTVRETVATRDHTERMLRARGVAVRSVPWGADGAGAAVSVDGIARVLPTAERVPADPSAAAFWLVGAAALPGSRVEIEEVGLNPTRTSLLGVLRRFGARVEVQLTRTEAGEPRGTILVEGDRTLRLDIAPEEVPGLIDELPAIAALAAHGGEVVVRGASELRVKESDRIAALVAGFRDLGIDAEERPDGFIVRGPASGSARPKGGRADAQGDHRMAMAFAIAALAGEQPSAIDGSDVVAISYPGFFETLDRLIG